MRGLGIAPDPFPRPLAEPAVSEGPARRSPQRVVTDPRSGPRVAYFGHVVGGEVVGNVFLPLLSTPSCCNRKSSNAFFSAA